jgi:hypothetical protein
MLAVLSIRFTDQPQRWAVAPAAFMGIGGLLLVVLGPSAHGMLNWVWPPALLALVIWMAVQVHRQLRSRSGRWLLYPVIASLAVASTGGGYETVAEAVDARARPMAGRLIDDEVVGMLLIDSTMPRAKATAAVTDTVGLYILGRVSALVSSSARFGLGRLYGQLDWGSLPPASRDGARASVAKAGQIGSTIDEYVEANTPWSKLPRSSASPTSPSSC